MLPYEIYSEVNINIKFVSVSLAKIYMESEDETQFETHLENCYNSNGFLLSDPQLLDNVPSELPHKLILSTFDTNLLLSKSLQKVVREIQKNRARCSIWTQETKEMSSRTFPWLGMGSYVARMKRGACRSTF